MTASPASASVPSLFGRSPLVIAALHLPPFNLARDLSMAEVEDYVLSNCETFAKSGIPAVKLQDETREPGRCTVSTVARMGALGRLIRREFPQLILGIIVQAHDPVAPIAIAQAAGADFVRLKVFVGSAMTSEGPKDALAVEALAYRRSIGADDVKILADVHDRTCLPLGGVPADRAALWAESLGADSLVITGSSFTDTLSRIEVARSAGMTRPVIVGGGITDENVGAALNAAQGVIVSTSLMRQGAGPLARDRWDPDLCSTLMDTARRATAA